MVKQVIAWFIWRYMRIGVYWQIFTYAITMLFTIILVQVGKRRKLSAARCVLYALLFFYLITAYVATVLSREQSSEYLISLRPFLSWKKAFSGHRFSIRLVIENIFLLMPVGILVPLLNRKKPYAIKTVLTSFLFSLSIETSQYFLRTGLFELDDLINNTIGAALGCGIVSVCLKIGTFLTEKKFFFQRRNK